MNSLVTKKNDLFHSSSLAYQGTVTFEQSPLLTWFSRSFKAIQKKSLDSKPISLESWCLNTKDKFWRITKTTLSQANSHKTVLHHYLLFSYQIIRLKSQDSTDQMPKNNNQIKPIKNSSQTSWSTRHWNNNPKQPQKNRTFINQHTDQMSIKPIIDSSKKLHWRSGKRSLTLRIREIPWVLRSSEREALS